MNHEDQRIELHLRDGTPVVARPLNRGDRELVAEGYRRLSPEARYQRFWIRGGEVIGDAMLDRLLNDQPPKHSIWTVFDPEHEDFKALGAASFWRSEKEPHEAEFTVTVMDSEQGRGVATLLLAILWVVAFRSGIERFVAYTMPENRRALRWMHDTGASGEWDGYNVVLRWDLGRVEVIPATAAGMDLVNRLADLSRVML